MSYKTIMLKADSNGSFFYEIDGALYEPPAPTFLCINKYNFINNCKNLRSARMVPKPLKKEPVGNLITIEISTL